MITITNERTMYRPGSAARDIVNTVKCAEKAGLKSFYVSHLDDGEDIEESLSSLPSFEKEEIAVWLDFIPSEDLYRKVYNLLLTKNIRLINSPEEHLLALKFENFYPLIATITPKSWIISSDEDLEHVCKEITYPVFVKGDVKSNKEGGWKHCVAEDEIRLRQLVRGLKQFPSRSRGKVIVRELVELKHTKKSLSGFPMGREYRLFFYKGELLSMGYYWEGEDPDELSIEDCEKITNLIEQVTCTIETPVINTPFLSIDVAQKTNGEWIVLELGDPQFSGLSNNDGIKLFTRLMR